MQSGEFNAVMISFLIFISDAGFMPLTRFVDGNRYQIILRPGIWDLST
jgi:hypothetical protein